MKSIFPYFQGAFIEANKKCFLQGESPTLIKFYIAINTDQMKLYKAWKVTNNNLCKRTKQTNK